ncbi:MAG: polymer-forming cytoskeletal protein [Sandaracinaceae bacterium]|nr:polymer-forming cytoskeletal protein [Sandaracinaceae bacterium]
MAETDLTGLSEINALLGAGTEYEGKLVFQGRVRVDGRFVGEIRGSDVLILGATADVTAHIDVGALIVLGGTLRGDVVAHRLVELHAPGAVHGDIETPQLFIDKGATFSGRCTMGAGPSEVLPLEPPPAGTSGAPQGHEVEATDEAPEGTAGDGTSPTDELLSAPDAAAPPAADEDDEPFVRAPLDDDGSGPDLRRAPRT